MMGFSFSFVSLSVITPVMFTGCHCRSLFQDASPSTVDINGSNLMDPNELCTFEILDYTNKLRWSELHCLSVFSLF